MWLETNWIVNLRVKLLTVCRNGNIVKFKTNWIRSGGYIIFCHYVFGGLFVWNLDTQEYCIFYILRWVLERWWIMVGYVKVSFRELSSFAHLQFCMHLDVLYFCWKCGIQCFEWDCLNMFWRVQNCIFSIQCNSILFSHGEWRKGSDLFTIYYM